MKRRSLTGPGVPVVRRDLGPVAWCALEVLVEHSSDGHTASASVRAVAAELGVAKNTAHRALAALARAGFIDAVQERDAEGRFRPGRYRLEVDHLLTTTPTKNTHHRHPTSTPTQLTLITPP